MNSIFLNQTVTGGNNFIFLMIGMFVIMYLFMILPQRRKQKREKQFLQNLTKGQNVVTTSGIHAKILDIGDTTCTLETGAGNIKFEKAAISVEFSNKLYGQTGYTKKN